MIPAEFNYHRPSSVGDAIKLLADHGEAARIIAGGHSLIPVMKVRLSDMSELIDLQAIGDLKGISVSGGTVTIGAMTTQSELIASAELAEAAPLIREAALQIADPQVRNCGTLGGNVANGDPGNDMPAIMQCLDATFVLEGPDGTREVKARDFYEAAYFTAREDGELLTKVQLPTRSGGYAYVKQKRKIGDYATGAAAVTLSMESGRCTTASIAMTNLSDIPVWCEAAAEALVGSELDGAAVKKAVAAMQEVIDPAEDNRGPVEFKRHIASTLLKRAIARAAERA